MDTVTVRHIPERQRYEITVDNQPVGLTAYREDSGTRVFTHTQVDAEHQGRGLATQLIRSALDDTRSAGLRVVAVCPMVAAFVDKHHDYDDIVDTSGD